MKKQLMAVVLSKSLLWTSVAVPYAEANALIQAPASRSGLAFSLASLPSRLGEVERSRASRGPGLPFVVLIQDVHDLPSAQQSVAQTLEFLQHASHPGSGPFLVGLEGATGSFRLDPYRRAISSPYHSAASSFLFQRRIVSGPEYFAMTAPQTPEVWGIEAPALYKGNVEAYRKAHAHQASFLDGLESLEQQLNEKVRHLPAALQNLDRCITGYHSGRLDLLSYLETMDRLARVRRPPQIETLLQALRLEKKLVKADIERERAMFIKHLSVTLPGEKLARLASLNNSLKSGTLSLEAFWKELLVLAPASRRPSLPAFERYMEYSTLSARIDVSRVFSELESFEQRVGAALVTHPEHQAFLSERSDLRVLGRLARQELGPEEWRIYQERRTPIMALARTIHLDPTVFEGFYDFAHRRNEALVRNLLERARALGTSQLALVAGGFHTSALEPLLEEAGAGYAVVRPAFIPSNDASQYLRLFNFDRLPIDQMLRGDRLYLPMERVLAERPIVVSPGPEPAGEAYVLGSALAAAADGADVTAAIRELASHFGTSVQRWRAFDAGPLKAVVWEPAERPALVFVARKKSADPILVKEAEARGIRLLTDKSLVCSGYEFIPAEMPPDLIPNRPLPSVSEGELFRRAALLFGGTLLVMGAVLAAAYLIKNVPWNIGSISLMMAAVFGVYFGIRGVSSSSLLDQMSMIIERPQAGNIDYFVDLANRGEIDRAIAELDQLAQKNPWFLRCRELLVRYFKAAKKQTDDVRPSLIRALEAQLGDKYEFYPGGVAAIDILPKGMSKAFGVRDYVNRHPELDLVVFFGNEFYRRTNKTGNDLAVAEMVPELKGAGKEAVVFSVDAHPEDRAPEAIKHTLWIGEGPPATKRILKEIEQALAAGHKEIKIWGKGPDADRSVTLSLEQLQKRGCLLFDVDDTIFRTKTETVDNEPEMGGLFRSFLEKGFHMGIMSGNSVAEQMSRVGYPLAAKMLEGRFAMYANGTATRLEGQGDGTFNQQNIGPQIAAADLAVIKGILQNEAKTNFGLQHDELLSWLAWLSYDGRYGSRPDFPNIRFKVWNADEPFDPTVIDSAKLKDIQKGKVPEEVTLPFIETRDGVQISLRLFRTTLPIPMADEWIQFSASLYNGDAAMAAAFRELRGHVNGKTPEDDTWRRKDPSDKAAVLQTIAQKHQLTEVQTWRLAQSLSPRDTDRVVSTEWYDGVMSSIIWGQRIGDDFKKSPFREKMEELMGVKDIVNDQRMRGEQPEKLAKEALTSMYRKLDHHGMDYRTLDQLQFNRLFGVQPVVMAAGHASRFSQFIHKAVATNGQGATNVELTLAGSYCTPGVHPVVCVGDKIIAQVLKPSCLADYNETDNLFKIKPEVQIILDREGVLPYDHDLIVPEKVIELFGRPVMFSYERQSSGHGINTVNATRRLKARELLETPFVQVNFSEMAEAILPEKSNSTLVTYLKMLTGDYVAVAGGKTAKGAVEGKGHFFLQNGELVSYTDWEQIPHLKSADKNDRVQAEFSTDLQELNKELARLREELAKGSITALMFEHDIRRLRQRYRYFSISPDGVVFSQETLRDVASALKGWRDLGEEARDYYRRNFAIREMNDGQADFLISGNTGIFNADIILETAEFIDAEYETWGFRAYDKQVKAGVKEPNDTRRLTDFWGVDIKNNETKSLVWNLFKILAKDGVRGKAVGRRVGFVFVGDNAPSSIKDGRYLANFSKTYLGAFPGGVNRLEPVLDTSLGAVATEILDNLHGGREAQALIRLKGLVIENIHVYAALVHHLLVVTKNDHQIAVVDAICHVDRDFEAMHEADIEKKLGGRAPPKGVLAGITNHAIAEAIDRDEMADSVYREFILNKEFRARTNRAFSNFYNHEKSNFLREKIQSVVQAILNELIEQKRKEPHRTVERIEQPRVIALNGGTAAVFMAQALKVARLHEDLEDGEALLLSIVSHIDDGGSTFRITSALWKAGYGILPPVGDQANALFSAFATQDKLTHILGDAGRVRDDACRTAQEFTQQMLMKTIFDEKIDVLNSDFLHFSADLMAALERVDREFISTGILPLKGASIRNLYLLGKMLEFELLEKRRRPHDNPAVTTGRYYQYMLDDLAAKTGIDAGRVSLITYDPATVYAAHRDHTFFLETNEGDSMGVPIKDPTGKVMYVNAVSVTPPQPGAGLRVTLFDRELKPTVHVIDAGNRLPIGNVELAYDGDVPALIAGGRIYRIIEDRNTLTLKLKGEGEEISVSRDGSGRAIQHENTPSVNGVDWIQIGGSRLLLRNRFIIMQTNVTETLNLSKIDEFGYISRKVGLDQGPFGEVSVMKDHDLHPNQLLIQYIENMKAGHTILVGPGSIFTSLLPHFMVADIGQALEDAKNRGVNIIYIMNGSYDNETYGSSITDIFKFYEQKAGRPLEKFISAAIFAQRPPATDPVDTYMKGLDTGYDIILDAWVVEFAQSRGEFPGASLREWLKSRPEAQADIRSRFGELIKKLHSKPALEIRTDPGLPSVAAKNSYGTLTPAPDEIAALQSRGIIIHMSPLLTLRKSVDRATGKDVFRVGHDELFLGKALAGVLSKLEANRKTATILPAAAASLFGGPLAPLNWIIRAFFIDQIFLHELLHRRGLRRDGFQPAGVVLNSHQLGIAVNASLHQLSWATRRLPALANIGIGIVFSAVAAFIPDTMPGVLWAAIAVAVRAFLVGAAELRPGGELRSAARPAALPSLIALLPPVDTDQLADLRISRDDYQALLGLAGNERMVSVLANRSRRKRLKAALKQDPGISPAAAQAISHIGQRLESWTPLDHNELPPALSEGLESVLLSAGVLAQAASPRSQTLSALFSAEIASLALMAIPSIRRPLNRIARDIVSEAGRAQIEIIEDASSIRADGVVCNVIDLPDTEAGRAYLTSAARFLTAASRPVILTGNEAELIKSLRKISDQKSVRELLRQIDGGAVRVVTVALDKPLELMEVWTKLQLEGRFRGHTLEGFITNGDVRPVGTDGFGRDLRIYYWSAQVLYALRGGEHWISLQQKLRLLTAARDDA